MKKITLTILTIFFYVLVQAQSWEEMKSGEYIKSDAKNLYTGYWLNNDTNNKIELLITTKKTRIKGKEVNYQTDAIFIKILNRFYQGEEISKKIRESIMLTGNSKRYQGFLQKDPFTNYDIIVKLYYVDKETLKLNVNTRYTGTSTIFPLGDTILKRKK